jgi:hypothetical protein
MLLVCAGSPEPITLRKRLEIIQAGTHAQTLAALAGEVLRKLLKQA